MRKYISFLTHILMRKISLWVVAIIYALVLASFSIIVPLLVNIPTIHPWIIDAKVTLTAVLMITAIFSAMICIFIFREPQEDGTELLICSKPIDRKKLILAKMLTYWIFLAFFSVVPVLIFLIMFAFPQFSNMSTTWLIVGFICGNIVSMFFFGSVAVLFSLVFNKIIVIIANMAIVILMGIYGTVIVATSPTPLGQMLQSKKYAATVVPYIDKNNNTASGSYFLPATQDFEIMLKVASLEGQKEIWSDAVKNSPIKILNGFNFANQLSTVYLSGGLDEAWYNRQLSMGIGASAYMDYDITDNVNYPGRETPTGVVWNDDNAEVWSNIGKTNAPATWFDLSSVSRNTTYDFVTANNAPLIETGPVEVLATLISDIATLNFGYGVDSAAPASIYTYGNAKYLNDVSKTESVDTYVAANFYDGKEVLANRKDIDWQNLQPNDFEVDLFNYILYRLLFTDDYCGSITDPDTQWNFAFNNDLSTEYWEIETNNIGPGKSEPAINKIITIDFFNKPGVKHVLNLDTPKKIGTEIVKFKYYSYLKLTGQAKQVITSENESGTADYTLPATFASITVPWDAYFKCVYNPQFNSLNVINMNEFGDFSRNLVSQGFVPINNFLPSSGTEINWMGFLLSDGTIDERYEKAKNLTYGINRLTPVYNGTTYNSDNKPGGSTVDSKIFEAYDFSKDPVDYTTWDNYPTLSGKYGYISKLGLMASSFLSNYVFSNYNQIYYGDETSGSFSEEYQSKLYYSKTPYLVYADMLFNYNASPYMPPGAYAAIYLGLAVILFAVAYTRFVKYDFK